MHGIVFVCIGFMTLMALALSLASATPAHGSHPLPVAILIYQLPGKWARADIEALSGRAPTIAPDGMVKGVDVPRLLPQALRAPLGELVRWLRTTFEGSGWSRRVELVGSRRGEVG